MISFLVILKFSLECIEDPRLMQISLLWFFKIFQMFSYATFFPEPKVPLGKDPLYSVSETLISKRLVSAELQLHTCTNFLLFFWQILEKYMGWFI